MTAVAMLPFIYGIGWLNATTSPPASLIQTTAASVIGMTSFEDQAIALQSSLWNWAWGISYSHGVHDILMEPDSGNLWNLTAIEEIAGNAVPLGTATFDVSAWNSLAVDTSVDVDPLTGHTIRSEIEVSAVAGVFERDGGGTTILATNLLRISSVDLTEPANSFDIHSLQVVEFSATINEAISLVNELGVAMNAGQQGLAGGQLRSPDALAAAGAEIFGVDDGGAAALGGGGPCGWQGGWLPCDVGNPSCECLCGGSLNFARAECEADYGVCIWACVAGAVAIIVACNLACAPTAAGAPACVAICTFALRAEILACAAGCALAYESCQAGACSSFLNCLSQCYS